MPYNFYVNALLFCGSLSLVFVLSSMTSILLLVRRTQRKEGKKMKDIKSLGRPGAYLGGALGHAPPWIAKIV